VTAYVIYEGQVHDPALYEIYKAEAQETIRAAGGRYIARGGKTVPLEGEGPAERTVVVEFPDLASALAWYHGEAYSAARARRQGAATARMWVVEGLD